MANGTLYLEGQSASLAEIDERLNKLAQSKGIVWYYREEATAEAPTAAMQVMQLVVKHQVPIRFSSKPDFSNAVLPQRLRRRLEMKARG